MSNVSNENFYTREHEWVRIEGNKAEIGITYHAQKALGDIDLPNSKSCCDIAKEIDLASIKQEWYMQPCCALNDSARPPDTENVWKISSFAVPSVPSNKIVSMELFSQKPNIFTNSFLSKMFVVPLTTYFFSINSLDRNAPS